MKKYVLVGAGIRGATMYGERLKNGLVEGDARLTAVYDTSLTRANAFKDDYGPMNVYENFDSMLAVEKPDVVIVTTVDAYHHEYIIKALDAGCDVMTEKPLTTDARKCNAILEAEKRTGHKVMVTFNMRYMTYAEKVKEIVKDGTIGDIMAVHMEWYLDTRHGASYFRRWHRYMDKSGSLLIHKASHHFDMINWWIDQYPEEVFAYGTRRFYGPTRENRGFRCLDCLHKKSCEYYYDLSESEWAKRYYIDAESDSGYIQDKCVFADDIDIYDSMCLTVKYSKGAIMSYSLVAHSPYEGWKATLSGTKGRMEMENGTHRAKQTLTSDFIKVYDRSDNVLTYEVPKVLTGHGGGDDKLIRMLVTEDMADPLGAKAGSIDGAMSMIIGAAANISIKENRPVKVSELIKY